MKTNNIPKFSHFLSFSLWREALRLLNFQISQKQKNRHYNTLSMFYYEKLGANVSILEDENYYKQKVANSFFYGLEKEFAVLSYIVPKPGLGLRNFKFFTYPMRGLYYVVGLYLLKLSQEFLAEYFATKKHIKSYYGAKLAFEKDSLQLTPNNTYYQKYYKSFRNQIRKETKDEISNKIIIKLDIENYFDEISIPKLLQLLSENIKPGIQADMCYDASTKEQIISFFHFLASGKSGIPQSDNDIISGFIGHLYMVFGDLFLDDEINKDASIVDKHAIIRYLDDIYISI